MLAGSSFLERYTRRQLQQSSLGKQRQTRKDELMSTGSESPKEHSLGPACLVVTILGLAVLSSVCAFGSWIVFSDQYPMAAKAIDKQLIPWVESSQLSAEDKEGIVTRLHNLSTIVDQRDIDKEQLLRLRNCLQDNPVLLWGGVQSVLAQAPGTDLNPTELEALSRIERRLLRAASERLLSRNDLEFSLQGLTKVREDGLSVEVRSDLTGDDIRRFMKSAESLLTANEIPNEGFDLTPAETFNSLVDQALKVP